MSETAKIPFLNLQPAYRSAQAEIDAALLRVAGSGWFLLGKELSAFESAWADYCGVPHAAGVANGLDALHLSLLALGVGPGDEVIVPAITYAATANIVLHCGATPVLVDVGSDGTVTAAAVAEAMTVLLAESQATMPGEAAVTVPPLRTMATTAATTAATVPAI